MSKAESDQQLTPIMQRMEDLRGQSREAAVASVVWLGAAAVSAVAAVKTGETVWGINSAAQSMVAITSAAYYDRYRNEADRLSGEPEQLELLDQN